MRIAVFQPPYPSTETVSSAEECLQWMEGGLGGLEPDQYDLVLLPEYASAPGLSDEASVREFSERQGGDFLRAVGEAARRLGCLIALSGPVQSGSRWVNRSLVFDASGEIAASYDKLHLTAAEKDDLGLTAGAKPTVFEYAGIRIGFATCFDLYFAEYFEALAAQRADLVLCPSYQRSESSERIRLIAQARALDSGVYLIRSSYAMETPEVGGHSLVATPAGELLVDAGADPCILTAEIDPGRKLVKPASHGRPPVEHRSLLEAHRRPAIYRPHGERARLLREAPFPHLCAHRGLSQACPENTLPAFAAAIAAGVHEIEFDLRTSRDGIPVVCHDESVDRTTNGSGRVAELLWDDIRRLDAGIRFDNAWSGVRVPRVEEVLELTDGRVGLNVHVKDPGPGGSTIRRVCDLLTEYVLTDTAYVALGTESSLQTALDYAPEVRRACLVRQGDPWESIAIAERYGCQRIQFSREVTGGEIRRAHGAGLICNLFWSDEPEEALRYVRDGIDVVLTNCAHTLIAAGLPRLERCPARDGA